MTTPLRRRLVGLCTVTAVLLGSVTWSAFTARRELDTLRRRLTAAEFQGFRIAGELSANVVGVNSSLLAYILSNAGEDWQQFEKGSAKLNVWIDAQHAELKSAREQQVLAEIDAEYDRYLALARTIHTERAPHFVAPAARVHQLDIAAKRLFMLAARLADAHRAVLGDLLAASQRSLRKLEALFTTGFALIIAIGGWGTTLVFRAKITPLRKRLIEFQELAAQREKLASLGVLAAGVAHEIRNPLTALKMRTFALRKKVATSEAAVRDTNILDGEIARLERIVGDFLLFGSPRDPQFAPVSPQALLGEVRELLLPELAGSGITIVVEPNAADVSEVRADSAQLKQVLINLVRNARESIEGEGCIRLRVRTDSLPLGGRMQEVVVMEVHDTGAGIPLEVQERLFDPFFTTKPAGTGLGLSVAMRILERHGGTLQFQTAPRHGTTFGIVLPRHPSR